jgi:hypothetical protein
VDAHALERVQKIRRSFNPDLGNIVGHQNHNTEDEQDNCMVDNDLKLDLVVQCISMKISSARHPQHSGQTEIVNRRLEWMLQVYIVEDRLEWANWLHLLKLVYNLAPHASTNDIPFHLLFGFVPNNYLHQYSGSLTEGPEGPETHVSRSPGASGASGLQVSLTTTFITK